MSEHYVIVGGGQAAAQAVQTLRQHSFAGRITLVGEENHLPYQRPPLSKSYLAGELERQRLYIKPKGYYQEQLVDMVLGVRATELHPSTRQVTLEDERILEYDGLLLATGSRVRRLSVAGENLGNIHYIRTIADVDALKDVFAPGRRLVSVGAGYIGLEVAAVARTSGMDVTVLETMDRVMARVVCPEVSRFYDDYHRAAGVKICCGTTVTSFTGQTDVEAVETSDNQRFPCDMVVVGIGILPEVSLATAAGLATADGVVVDEFARTEDPRIVAAGDCTNHPNRILGHRVRLESVPNAIEQARTAAMSLLGEPNAYASVPWFWSDQYDLKLQIAGLSQGYDQTIIRGSAAEQRFAAFYLRSGVVIAVDAINSPKDFLCGKKLIAAGAAVPTEHLANTAMDLATLAKELG